uniref:NFU1 iron-sulfur cluster scaffold homolog, mitochondrial n=1 Tax=Oncorhynchus tshawytscha TaxID=74940 RepID=A0A8C8M819_ONCTS
METSGIALMCYSLGCTQNLFEMEGVKSVFYGPDFITVTKVPNKYTKPIPPISVDHPQADCLGTEVVLQTNYRNDDGGDVIFKGFENGTVKLKPVGSCTGCPSSTVTLKNGIQNMLQFYIPEVDDVEQVRGREEEKRKVRRREKPIERQNEDKVREEGNSIKLLCLL